MLFSADIIPGLSSDQDTEHLPVDWNSQADQAQALPWANNTQQQKPGVDVATGHPDASSREADTTATPDLPVAFPDTSQKTPTHGDAIPEEDPVSNNGDDAEIDNRKSESLAHQNNNLTADSDSESVDQIVDWEPESSLDTIVFIDLRTPDYHVLIQELQFSQPDTAFDIVFIASDEDGVDKISNTLERYHSVSAVHIISHGSDGEVQLGSVTLNDALISDRGAELLEWSDQLSDNADILFYGCNLAATASGVALVEDIATLTGADIAASDDLTGHADLGGDWDLEYEAGLVETDVAVPAATQAEWQQTLLTYTVTNTNDSGPGSLRQLILDTNATAGIADTIEFNIPGVGPHTISPVTPLPTIADSLSIDGWSEPNYANDDVPVVILDGASAGVAAVGLDFSTGSDASSVRGLSIVNFTSHGISLDASNSWIYGNNLGVLPDGVTAAGNGGAGITIQGIASNNRIGTNDDGSNDVFERNVIGGNLDGVVIAGATQTGNVVAGNYIGVGADGVSVVANTLDGVRLEGGATNNIVGGLTSDLGNVISGNDRRGVSILNETSDGNTVQHNLIGISADQTLLIGTTSEGIYSWGGGDNTQILDNTIAGLGPTNGSIIIQGDSTGTIIQGNYIGTDSTETYQWGSETYGILLWQGVSNTTIGGTGPGEGNVIAYTGANSSFNYPGVWIFTDAGTGNSIRGNSIYGSTGLGVDLGDFGVTKNDVNDTDTGPNNSQNWAILNSAAVNDIGQFSFRIDTDTLAAGTFAIDFYASTDRGGGQVEGKRWLGNTNVSGQTGVATGVFLNPTVQVGEFITLITTDASGNSSEFSNYAVATDSDAAGASPGDLQAIGTNNGGLSLNADGGNDVFLQSDYSPLFDQSAITIEVQFSIDTPATDITTLLSYSTISNQDELFLGIDSTGELFFRTSTDGSVGTSSINKHLNLFDGNQHHVAVSWENGGGVVRFYVDGIEVQSRIDYQKNAIIESDGVLIFGQHQTLPASSFVTTDTFQGTLHDVRIFSDVRTGDEINASHRSELTVREEGLVANWRFNDQSIDGVITDFSFGNNLTRKHSTEPGFTPGDASLTFTVDETAIDGTVVGNVTGVDAEREALIAALLAADPDLRYSAETNKFYQLVQADVTWEVASATAQATFLDGVSGQLMTIFNATEDNLLVDFVEEINDQVFLGGSDSAVEGEWRWQSAGSDADFFWRGGGSASGGYVDSDAYAYWADTFEPNGGVLENNLIADSPGAGWFDINDTHTASYIVEWNADTVLDASQALVYSIQSQTISGAFAIDSSTGQIIVSDGSLLDYETDTTHILTVQTVDTNGNTLNENFIVSLTDQTEVITAPTDLSSGIELNIDGGNDSYLIASDGGTILGNASEFTVEITFATKSSNQLVLMSYLGGVARNDLNVVLESDGSAFFIIDNISILGLSGIDYNTLRDGETHHIALSWSNLRGDWIFYVDGVPTDHGTGVSTGGALDGSPGVGSLVFGQEQETFGGGFQSSETFSGTLYDIRLWNEARPASEILLNYQYKINSTALPSGLIANWQMDGFNGLNEVVDIVSANNLSVGHATGAGFITSTPLKDLHVSENASNGTSVGFVSPTEPDFESDVVSDGLFTKAGTATSVRYTDGQTLGDWTVRSGTLIDLINPDGVSAWGSTPSGGDLVHLWNVFGSTTNAIEQTFSTEPGKQYQVVLAASGNWASDTFSKTLRIAADGQSVDQKFYKSPPGWALDNLLWDHRSFTFTADDTTATLSFEDRTFGGGRGTLIADVQVIEVNAAITSVLNSDSTLSYDAATGKFYKVVTTIADYATATSNANADQLNGVGGQLVTIRSAYEQELIRSLGGYSATVFLTGGTDATVDGEWNWINNGVEADRFWNGAVGGSAPADAYSNFSGEPGGGAAENNLLLRPVDGAWIDIDGGSSSFAYVVEWDASAVIANFNYSLTDDAGGRFVIDSNTGEITVADGSLLDYENSATHDITIEVMDVDQNTYSEIMSVAVDNRFEITQSVPGSQFVLENEHLVFSAANGNALTVSDTVAGSDTRLQVYISTQFNGTLWLSQTTGLNIGGGTNGGTFMTIQGTESDINAAFDGLTYVPVSGYSGPVTITMTTSLGADLEGRYQFEGNTFDTSLGLTQHGTALGGATTVTDVSRGSDVLLLDTPGEHVEIPGRFNDPANLTLASWINLDAGRLNAEVISMGNNLILRADDSALGLTLGYYQGAGVWSFVSAPVVNLDGQGWNHVAATFDDSNDLVTLYLNGEKVTSFQTTDTIDWTVDANTSANTKIGTHGLGSPGFEFQGMIDDTRIYDRAISADEIAALAAEKILVSDTIAVTVDAVNSAPRLSTSVVITNSSFESPVLAGGSTTTTTVTGWIQTGAQTGIWNPDVSHFVNEAPDGENVAYIDSIGTISQTTTAVFSAGTDYEFTVAVGDKTGVADPTDWEIRLYAGGQLLGSASNSDVDPADGTFADVTLTLTAVQLNTYSASYGQNLIVELYDGGLSDNIQFDNVRLRQTPSQAFTEGGAPVVLDNDLQLIDEELSGIDDFGGATLSLLRDGGANPEDVFSGTGNLVFNAGSLELLSVSIGSVSQSVGSLALTLNAAVTNAQINEVMQSIAYENISTAPPPSVQINWTFDDGNAGAQGLGGPLQATGSTIVNIQNAADLQVVAPISETTQEDTAIVFSGANFVQVVDGISTLDSPVRVSLSVANGLLTLASTAGITFVEGANGDSAIVVEGLESSLNSALDGLIFEPNLNFNGSDTLNIALSIGADLDGHYTFDVGDANDQSAGIAYNGILIDDAKTVSDGTRGEVLSLDGNGDYVQIPGEFGQPQNITVSAWVDANNGYSEIISIGGIFDIRVDDPNDGGYVNGFYHDGSGYNSVVSSTAIAGTGWHHIALSFDNTTKQLTLYIDGAVAATQMFTGSIAYSGGDTYLGINNGNTLALDGQLDDVRFYSRALSADEIAALAIDHTEVTDSVAITVTPVNDAPTFNVTEGYSSAPIPGSIFAYSGGAVIDANERMLVIGRSDDGLAVARFNANGSLDTSFANGGVIDDNFGLNSVEGNGITVQSDGKILVSGTFDSGSDFDYVVARYHEDGTLDTTFDGDGYKTIDLFGKNDFNPELAVQADGRIIIAGTAHNAGVNQFAFIRLDSNGSYDTTFSGDGQVTFAVASGSHSFKSLELQSDGRILFAGFASGNFATFTIGRLNTNGTLDTSFGGTGIVQTDFGSGGGSAHDIEVQPDGRIVVTGSANSQLVVSRYLSNGNLDTTFNGTGFVTTNLDGLSVGYAVALQADGKIVAAGEGTADTVIRFNNDGSLDNTFGSAGYQTLQSSFFDINGIEITPSGKIVVAGGTGSSFVVEQLTSSGQPDTTFGYSSLDNSAIFVEGGMGVVLDFAVSIFDAELSLIGNYSGATLTLVRSGGANSDDSFSFSSGNGIGLITWNMGGPVNYELEKNGSAIASLDYSTAGQVVISFTDTNGETPTQTDMNVILSQLTYFNSSDAPPASVQIDWTFNDGGDSVTTQGVPGLLEGMGSTRVNFTAVNDAPVVTAPLLPLAASEQTALNIHGAGFSVSDADDGGATVIATLSVGEGRVLISAGDSGVVVQSGDRFTSGNSTDTVSFSGTLAQMNALLSGSGTGTIVYYNDNTVASDTPSASTTMTLTVNDQGNSGSDPGTTGDAVSEEDSASQTINISSVNDAPLITGSELISNGSFSAGFSGWSTSGTVSISVGTARFGGGNNVGPHTLEQTIATTSGETYQLEFDYRDDGGWNQQLLVSVDGAGNVLTTDPIVTDVGDSSFIRYRTTFIADSASTTVTFTDTSDDALSYSAESGGVDGYLDNITVRQIGGLNGAVVYTENTPAVLLDSDIALNDAELGVALDTFNGTTLSLNRAGGASNNDQFSHTGLLSAMVSGNNLSYNGSVIGAVNSNSGGALQLTFNASADLATITGVMQSIAYSNGSDDPQSSVQIDWVFYDANAGAQGSGGALTTTSSTNVIITPVNDAPLITTNMGGSTTSGGTVSIASSMLDGADPDDNGIDLTYSVTAGLGNGQLELTTNPGVAITSFTQADLDAGFVVYVHDGLTASGDSFDLSLADGGEDGAAPATGTFNIGVSGGIADNYTTTEDNPLSVDSVTGVLTNDGTAGGAPSTPFVAGYDDSATSGNVVVQADGSFNYDPNGQFETLTAGQTAIDTFTYTYDDGNGYQQSVPVSITINGVNDIPLISGLNGDTLSYAEGDSATVIEQGGDVVVTDVDGLDFDTGSLTVAFGSGSNPAEDVLSVHHQGTAVGQIGVSGSNVTYAGTVVGIMSGGSTGVPLSVTLNSNSTAAAISQLVQNISYLNTNTIQPATSARTVDYVVTDRDGGVSAIHTAIVNVSGVNDAPVNTVPGTQTVAEETPTPIAGVSITDVDAGIANVTTRLQVSAGVLNVILAGAATISQGNNGTNDLTILGTVADINATLSSISYTGNTQITGVAADTLTITTDDAGNAGNGSALLDIDTVQIDLTAVNDAPIVTGPVTAYSVDEQTALSLAGTGFSVTDVDAAGGLMNAAFAVGEGAITVTAGDSGVVISGTNNTAMVTLAGTLSQINNLLTGTTTGTITYYNSSNTPSAATTLTIAVNDNGNTGADPGISGDGSSEQHFASQTINLNATNDIPTNTGTLVSDLSVTEDVLTAIDLSSINIADVDAANDALTVSLLTATGGQLTTTVRPGITLGGTATAPTFTGQLADLNNYFNAPNSVRYVHSSTDFNGNNVDTITVLINDNSNNGSGGGTIQNLGVINVDIIAVNDAPLNTVPLQQSAAEETTTAIPGISVDDIDSASANITTQLHVSAGQLEVTLAGAASIVGGVNGTGDLTILGNLADVNATVSSLRYTGNAQLNGIAADTLTVTTNDAGNMGIGGTKIDIDTIPINISAVNDSPIAYGPATSWQLNEQTSLSLAGTGFSIIDIDAASGTMIAIISVGEGAITVAAGDSGVVISSGNNSSAVTFTGTLSQINSLLTGFSSGTISYFNAADVPSATTIVTLTVNDNGNTGTDPGISGDSTTEQHFVSQTINITAVNDAPNLFGIDALPTTFIENTAATVVTDSLILIDADSAFIEAATISISNNFTAGEDVLVFTDQFNISGSYNDLTGELRLTGTASKADYETAIRSVTYINTSESPMVATRTVDIVVDDGDSSSNLVSRQVEVIPVNDAPLAADSVITGLEDNPITLHVADFGFSDPVDAGSFSAVVIDVMPAKGELLLDGFSVGAADVISVTDIARGALVFVPAENEFGIAYDYFEFRVTDNDGTLNGGQDTSVAANIITINITSVSDAPTGADTVIGVSEDTAYIFSQSEFSFSDVSDGDQFAGIYIVSLPENGVLTLAGDPVLEADFIDVQKIDSGALVFIPGENAVNSELNALGYLVSDNGQTSNGGSNRDPVVRYTNVDMIGVNDPPKIETAELTVDEGSDIIISSQYLSGYDVDDLLPKELTFTVQSLPEHGELSLSGSSLTVGDTFTFEAIITNQLSYTHDGSETSADTIAVSLIDGGEDRVQAVSGLLSILVREVIDLAPVTEDDQIILNFGDTFDSAVGDLLVSGFQTLGGTLLQENTGYVIELEQAPQRGTVEINPDGTFLYVHDDSAVLQDLFTYRITNEDSVYSIATISISIEPPLAPAFEELTLVEQPMPGSSAGFDERQVTESIDAEEAKAEIDPSMGEILESLFEEPKAPEPDGREETIITLDSYHGREFDSLTEILFGGEVLEVKKHNVVNQIATIGVTRIPAGTSDIEFNYDTRRYGISNPNFLQSLAQLESDLADAPEEKRLTIKFAHETVLVISFGATAGVLSWVLRSGTLLGTLLAATPILGMMDPLRILNSTQNKKNDNADKVEQIFDSNSDK